MRQRPKKLNAVRKTLLWWFDWPGNPCVSVSASFDFSVALGYLERVNEAREDTITVHHLVAGAIARLLAEYPQANARIVGKNIFPVDHVGVAMPVNLLNVAGNNREVGITILEKAETLSLAEIAVSTRAGVAEERSGQNANPIVRFFYQLADNVPYPVLAAFLNMLDKGSRYTPIARRLFNKAPITTVISNAGAAFGRVEGSLFRAASLEMPQRIFHVGTIWGVSAIQNEVLAIQGQAVVRPVLPVALVFDHRLFDGVIAGQLLVRLGEILRDPDSSFGDGDSRIA